MDYVKKINCNISTMLAGGWGVEKKENHEGVIFYGEHANLLIASFPIASLPSATLIPKCYFADSVIAMCVLPCGALISLSKPSVTTLLSLHTCAYILMVQMILIMIMMIISVVPVLKKLCWWWWLLFPCVRGFGGECSTIYSLHALFFFEVEISSCKLIPLFRPGSVHSGSAS